MLTSKKHQRDGAIVKSGTSAAAADATTANARNAETLFESLKVEEIRGVEKRTIKEAEDKEEELRRGYNGHPLRAIFLLGAL